jgi:hypothetical protein
VPTSNPLPRNLAAISTHLDDHALGPQLPGESGLSRRIRFHQSWYRVTILGRQEFGILEGRHPRPLGSVLSQLDAARGYNFVSPNAFELFGRRRKQGWGVDPVRCLGYLTSSQALTLNLIGVLASDPDWLVAVFSRFLGRTDIIGLRRAEVEFAPTKPSDHLSDKTRVDVLLEFETLNGLDVVVIEVKLADRFNSRHVRIWENDRYHDLAKVCGMWRTEVTELRSRDVNQLLRCHALGASMLGPARAKERPPTLVVIHHPEDVRITQSVAPYLSVLRDPGSCVLWPLSDLLLVMEQTGTTVQQIRESKDLRIRYIDHGLSESAWLRHLQHRRALRPCQ